MVAGERLLVRADGGPKMGTGHVMRCLALAQAWQDEGGRAVFAMRDPDPGLEPRLQAEGFEVRRVEGDDAPATVALARELEARWAVVDGYQFDSGYQRALKSAGLRVLFVDDYGHCNQYSADLVLNQNIHATEELYRQRSAGTELLLGTKYALLRREFRNMSRGPLRPMANRLLVTLGGADPENVTRVVLEGVVGVKRELETKVVLGPSNPHRASLERFAGPRIAFLTAAEEMPSLMQWADAAVVAAGITCWEVMYMQAPFAVVAIAENQRPIAAELGRVGAALDLGWYAGLQPAAVTAAITRLLDSRDLREGMAERERGMVDGHGVARVLRRMRAYSLELRPVSPPDCATVWKWANDPETRAASFSSDPIPWEDHQRWFATHLQDPATRFFIAVDKGRPMGQVRFQREGERATISVSVAAEYRGRGLGMELIRAGSAKMLGEPGVRFIDAYIRMENDSSVRAFRGAGYREVEPTSVRGVPARHMVLGKSEEKQ